MNRGWRFDARVCLRAVSARACHKRIGHSVSPRETPRFLRRWLSHSRAVPTALFVILVAGCGRESSVSDNRRIESPAPVNVEDVKVLGTDSDFTVFYRTRTSIRDGEAQVAEIPKVWTIVVRPRLKTTTTRVTMMPEDASGTSVSFTFTSVGGQWTALAPWKVVIPAK